MPISTGMPWPASSLMISPVTFSPMLTTTAPGYPLLPTALANALAASSHSVASHWLVAGKSSTSSVRSYPPRIMARNVASMAALSPQMKVW